MWNFRYYAHCIELNCNFTIWLEVTVNSPFRRINLGSTPVTGGVTQTNKADKRSQRQAVTALYYYHTPPRPVPTLPKPHYPLLCTTTLASLVKGRWIDGKAQTVALLHFYLRYIRLFYSPNFLPSRRRDCFTPTNLSIPTTFSKAHPSPRLAPSLPQPHLSFSRYSSSNIHFLPVYP